MSTLRTLSSLKAWQLKHAAFLMGLPTTGTKSEMQNLVNDRVDESLSLSRAPRIVSVDMGIKNLGICVLEAPNLAEPTTQSQGSTALLNQSSPLKVLAWQKMDVLSHLSSLNSDGPGHSRAILSSEDSVKGIRKQKTQVQPAIDATVFRPSMLSKTALNVARDLLYTHDPSHILIERQRFRSGGAAAVQEWTLRVNMLESMIWACLETLRHESKSGLSKVDGNTFPTLQEISPARVAKFWCSGPSAATVVPKDLFSSNKNGSPVPDESTSRGTRKIEKKDKIAVVRSWLTQSDGVEAGGSNVALEFADGAQEVSNLFVAETQRNRKQSGNGVGKLDDLADCLLQGVAWVRWEENRRKIRKLLSLKTNESMK